MDKQLEKELMSLNGERKMSENAIRGHQWHMSQQLNGSMGKDMLDVLDGKKEVKFTFWQRAKNNLIRVLKLFEKEEINGI